MTEIKLVDTPEAIQPALKWLNHLPLLGIDVERDDSHHYELSPALIQVGGDNQVAIFDPVTLTNPDDWKAIADFVASRTTIFHAMQNDLPPLAQVGIVPTVVHDTSLAAAFLDLPLGLGDLSKEVLHIELAPDKNQMQRAPWERRPLTPAEIEYAAGDVAFLPELFHKIAEFLHSAERYEWYLEELHYQVAKGPASTRRSWHSVKGSKRLDEYSRARFAFLWEARENMAYTIDTTPGMIFPDRLLSELAAQMPQTHTGLRKLGLSPKAIRLYGDDIVQAIRDCQAIEPLPKVHSDRFLVQHERDLTITLRETRTVIAEQHDLNPGFMLPVRNITKAVASRPTTAEDLRMVLDVRDWQWNLLAKAFTQVLEEYLETFGSVEEEQPKRKRKRKAKKRVTKTTTPPVEAAPVTSDTADDEPDTTPDAVSSDDHPIANNEPDEPTDTSNPTAAPATPNPAPPQEHPTADNEPDDTNNCTNDVPSTVGFMVFETDHDEPPTAIPPASTRRIRITHLP